MNCERLREKDKGRSIGLYLYDSIIEAGSAHAAEIGKSFSGYVNDLIRADLEAAGKLPGSPIAEVVELAREAAGIVGVDEVRAALEALGQKRLVTAAGDKAA